MIYGFKTRFILSTFVILNLSFLIHNYILCLATKPGAMQNAKK